MEDKRRRKHMMMRMMMMMMMWKMKKTMIDGEDTNEIDRGR